jgi:RHS repeat-associated protein
MNYQDLRIDFLCEIEQISELSFTNGYGDHPTALVKGTVDEKKHAEILRGVNAETPLVIRGKDDKVLFSGFVSDIKFAKVHDLYSFQMTAKGATAKMDVTKRSRTFFKKGITYQQIVDGILRSYPGATMISNVDLAQSTSIPIIQYKETDWEFIGRLASMFGATLLPAADSLAPRFTIGCSQRNVEADITISENEIERDLLQCLNDYYEQLTTFAVQAGSEEELLETIGYPKVANYTVKAFTLREYYPVGTTLRINGAELVVSYVEGYLDKGELCFDYVARLAEGICTVYRDNPELAGASLVGTVKKRVGNTVSLTLEIDQDDGIAGDGEDYFFAYALETKGYYCMPVEGARVHLYFPSSKEWEAIAVHSIRSGEGSETTSNPSNRSLSNTTGAAIKLTPDGISMMPDSSQTVNIKLGADGNVEIKATDIVLLGQDVTIGQGEGGTASNVSLSAADTLFLGMLGGGEECAPKEDHFIALQGVAQLYASSHIYHVTSGAPKPVMPTYDDAELLEAEAQQAADNNKKVTDTLIERNKNAAAKFGMGLLMAALGTALIVVTGGAGAVIVGAALCVFAAAEMAEATHSQELAMKGDWSTPAENLLKHAIPEPYYSLVKNGLIIAGSIMFTAGLASSMGTAGAIKAGADATSTIAIEAGKQAATKAVTRLLVSTAINTAGDLACDLIPDGKIDRSFMDYLNSASTSMMITSLTTPCQFLANGTGKWQTFKVLFASGVMSSTLGDIASGELSGKKLLQNLGREAFSALVGSHVSALTNGMSCWKAAIADTISDTVVDTTIQCAEIALDKDKTFPKDFSMQRLVRTLATSAANNLFHCLDPVNVARGNLLVTKMDLIFAGLYGMEEWVRRYDSVLDYDGAFGMGWFHSFESRVIAIPLHMSVDGNLEIPTKELADYRIVVALPDAHREYFVYQNNAFVPEKEGAPYHFEIKEDGTFLLEEWQEEKYKAFYYDRHGRLIALKAGRNSLPTKIFYVENGDDVKMFARGTIDHVEFPGGQNLKFTYKNGHIVAVSDHVGRTVKYQYENGRLTNILYPTGGEESYLYDENGHLSVMKGEDGRDFMTNVFDKKGRVVCQRYPDGNECRIQYFDQERKTIFTYNDSGRIEVNYYNDKEEVVRREYGDGIFETMEYDDYGNKIAETDKNGNTTKYRYDQNGHLFEKALPEGLVISYVYDEAGRLIKESDNTGACTVSEYDKEGNLICTRVKIDEHSVQKTTYERDQYGRMTSMKDALGNTTKYFYEEDIDKPTEINTAEGYVIRYRYDKAGRRTGIITDYGEKEIAYSETDEISRETDALGNTTRYLRDSVGNLLKLIRPNDYDPYADNGQGMSYEYDYLDRLVATKYPDGSIKKYKVNMDGIVLAENLLPVLPEEADAKATVYQYDGRQYRTSKKAPDGGVTMYVRDRNGNLAKQIRPEEYAKDGKAGAGLSYSYDKQGRLTAILDDQGNIYRAYRYDLKGRMIESIIGDAGYGTKYTYDLAGQMIEKRVPVRKDEEGSVLWNVTLYEYDVVGNRVLERRSGDEVKEGEIPQHFVDIRMSYDKQNRLIKVEDSLGAAAEYTYDCLNKRLTEKYRINEEKARLICYSYDAAGRLVERMESVDLTDMGEDFHAYRKKEFLRKKFERDKNGNIVKISLPNGGMIYRTYDCMDRVLTEKVTDVVSGLNRTTEYVYDASGKIISRKVHGEDSKDTLETTYRYDACGHMIAETNAENGTTRYFVNKNGEVVKTVSPDQYDEKTDDGDGYCFAYDVFGRLTTVTDAYGNIVEQNAYDVAGRILSKRDEAGLLYRAEYDLGGRRTSIFADEEKPVQTFEYDSLGNIIGVTDGEKNYTNFTLDAWGRITEIKKPDGSVEAYAYDHVGNIVSTTDGNGSVIRYDMNSLGKIKKITDQAGNADMFSYDREGNIAKHKDRNGKTVTNTYGSFGYLLSERGEDGTFRSRKYNALGQLTESASNHVVYRYDYDRNGRVKTKYIGGKAALSYSYTKGGRIASITDVSGKTTKYAYDKNGKLIKVSEAANCVSIPEVERDKVIVDYTYDGIGRLSGVRFANGVRTCYTYDGERNLATLKTVGANESVLMSYSYRYDRNGNRTEKADGKGNAIKYAYDSLQRLCEASYPKGGTERFSFDAAGNRVCKTTDSYVERYTYDERNRMTQSERTAVGEDTSEVVRYLYDAQGSLLSEEGTSVCKKYLYNDFHQCVSAEVIHSLGDSSDAKGADRQENVYDGEGLRFALIENGERTEFVTDGWENLAELEESGKVVKRVIRGMGIAAREEDGAYHYYHGNERSDVELITDGAGNIANRYFYDAFGAVTDSEEKITNRYRSGGESFDQVVGQYYLRKRYYNPASCRFTQEDEYRGDGLNLYVYCANNPVKYMDPTGYEGEPTPPVPGDWNFVGPTTNSELQDYYSNVRAYQGEADITKIPPLYRVDPNSIIQMDYKGRGYSGTNSSGWVRDNNLYFREYAEIHPEYFSPDNLFRINNNQTPIVDEQYIEHFPQYSDYMGQDLIHHHVGGGGQVAAVPKGLHPGSGGIHNYEKAAGVTNNDPLSEVGEAFVPAKEKKKRGKGCS